MSAQKLLHILSAKCPVFLGLLQIDYVKLFMNDHLGSAQKLLGILSAKCPVFIGLLRTDYVTLFMNDHLRTIVISYPQRNMKKQWCHAGE